MGLCHKNLRVPGKEAGEGGEMLGSWAPGSCSVPVSNIWSMKVRGQSKQTFAVTLATG